MTQTHEVLAGNRRTVSWPVTLDSGDITALDVVVLVVDRATRQILQTLTPTITPGATPNVGTIAVAVEFPDAITTSRVTVRLDGDDGSGDVIADEVVFRVTSAIVQRP